MFHAPEPLFRVIPLSEQGFGAGAFQPEEGRGPRAVQRTMRRSPPGKSVS